MPTYHHTCDECKTTVELNVSITQYEEFEEIFGRSEGGNVRVPCDTEGCEGWSMRDYTFGVATGIVRGGYKYSTRNYRAGAEEAWMREEIEDSKRALKGQRVKGTDYNTQRPYAGYALTDPEKSGFKRVSPEVAKERAEAAKKTQGDAVAKTEKARKNPTTGS